MALEIGPKYTLELRDSDGDLFEVLHNAHEIKYNEILNGAPTLEFKLPFVKEDYEPGTEIDIGEGVADRSTTATAVRTFISKGNPANATGTIDTIKIWADANLTGCKVATFYETGTNKLKCRDVVTIGSVTAGSEQTFSSLSLLCVAGDYIGLYWATGLLELDSTGGLGVWYLIGDYTDIGDEATFTLLATAAISIVGTGVVPPIGQLAPPNEIWLRDYEADTLVSKFRIATKWDARKSSARLTSSVKVEGLLNQLADEYVMFPYLADEKYATVIVDDLLALQSLTPPITKGTIEPTVACSVQISENDTLLQALYRVQGIVGGYISVDNDRKLQWLNDVGEDKGQQIRRNKNLKGIEHEIDYTAIANRIYAFGQGSGIDRVEINEKQTEYDAPTTTILRGSENAPESQTSQNSKTFMTTGEETRVGQRLTITNRIVTSLSFYLCKKQIWWEYPSPSGCGALIADVWFAIRKVSDDSIIQQKKWGSAAALPHDDPDWFKVTWDNPVNINEEVRMLCELRNIGTTCSGRNGVYAYRQSTDVKGSEVYTDYKGSYSDDSGKDCAYIYEYTSTSTTVRRCGQRLSMGQDKFEHSDRGNDITDFFDVYWKAKTFTPIVTHKIEAVKLRLSRYPDYTPGTITVGIRLTDAGKPTGADLCSGTLDGDTITTDEVGEVYEISLSPTYTLVAGTKYAIVARAPSSGLFDYVNWTFKSSMGAYLGGNVLDSDDSGATWIDFPDEDAIFEEWGIGRTLYKLVFPLAKVGTPSGEITFTVRKVSDDSIIASGVLGDAKNLTTEFQWLSAAFTPGAIREEIRISVEFAGGDNNDYVIMPRTTSDVKTGESYTYYTLAAGWTDNASYDSPYIYAWVIENTVSQGEWGIHPKVLSNINMTDFEGLLAWTQLKLTELEDPRVAYSLDAVNLAAHSAIDFDFDALQLGSQITVIDEDLNINVKVRVVRIEHEDMLHPERMMIEVANRVQDITDTLTALAA